MHRFHTARRVMAAALLGGLLGAAPALHAAPPPEAATCVGCHGADGLGNAAAGYPRLAALPAPYLAAQLRHYGKGTRNNPIMSAMAKPLTAAQITAVAAYYAGLPAGTPPEAPTPAPDAQALAVGERLALRGDWNAGIPACTRCHGPGAAGVGADFPALVGQPAAYLEAQIKAWKDGSRRGDPQGLMRTVALRLSDAQTQAVAQWLATQPLAPGAAASAMVDAPPPVGAASRAAAPAASGTRARLNAAAGTGARFTPPPESAIPDDDFGKMVRLGRNIVLDTPTYAKAFVGNTLSCANCHLDAGRMAGSAPLWAAYVSYPAYRAKNHKVNTFAERLQGCFTFSQNGSAPPLGSETLVALEAYAFWLSKGLPVDEKVAGRGYPELPKPARAPDYARGQAVYAAKCALCHGADGQGQLTHGATVFPPLWGPQSFNWGAGMASYKNAAAFIRANMPYGMSYSLSPQEAWDVAYFMNAHERPQDPRWLGSVAATRAKFHNTPFSLYGTAVKGTRLGDTGAPLAR